MNGFPDYQQYAQWVGPILAEQDNYAIGGGNIVTGALPVSSYAYIGVAVDVGGGSVFLSVTQARTGVTTGVFPSQSLTFPTSSNAVAFFPVLGDTASLKFIGSGAGVTLSYIIYGSNQSGEPVFATSDGLGRFPIPATAPVLWNGATFDLPRVPNVVRGRNDAAVVAGTPQTIWTPAAGKKFRLMVAQLSLSVAGQIFLKDSGTTILRSPQLQAGATWTVPPIGNGILSAAAGNVLQVDVSANGNVGGFVAGTEE